MSCPLPPPAPLPNLTWFSELPRVPSNYIGCRRPHSHWAPGKERSRLCRWIVVGDPWAVGHRSSKTTRDGEQPSHVQWARKGGWSEAALSSAQQHPPMT